MKLGPESSLPHLWSGEDFGVRKGEGAKVGALSSTPQSPMAPGRVCPPPRNQKVEGTGPGLERKRRLALFLGADLRQCPGQGWGHWGQDCWLKPAGEQGYEALMRAAE